MTMIADNIDAVKTRIAEACRRVAQPADTVTLIAVSKAQPIERIEAALDCGLRIFGENYVQEAHAHWAEKRTGYPDLELHMIGPLQTNKAGQAVELFDVIQSVDREKLARALAKEMKKHGRRLPIYVQVNIGEEPQKSGVLPSGLPDLLKVAREECELDVVGLMAIPPAEEPCGFYAALLHKLAKEHGLANVSIGMSGDYEEAIEFGATHVRVGTGIFGERQKRA